MATVIKPKRTETALAIPSSGSLEAGELAMNITDGKFYTKTTGILLILKLLPLFR